MLLDRSDRDAERGSDRPLVKVGVVTQQNVFLVSAQQHDSAERSVTVGLSYIVVERIVACIGAEPLLGSALSDSAPHLVASEVQHD